MTAELEATGVVTLDELVARTSGPVAAAAAAALESPANSALVAGFSA